MGVTFGVFLPLMLLALAIWLGRRELQLYRDANDFGSDLFVYSKGRLWRRMTGVGMLVVLGATLAAVELFPASSSWGASLYLALLCTEVLALLVLPIIDLWETAKTAKPGDLKRQGGPDRRTRSRPRRPQ